MQISKKIIQIDENKCDGCGRCVRTCAGGAIEIKDGKARLIADNYCDGLGVCLEKCPRNALRLVERKIEAESTLANWPIKIRLIPREAAFLQNSELLILADCTGVAFPQLHTLLAGKIVLTGCPKFDDANATIQKLASIFAYAGIKHISIGRMEVPCCAGLSVIVRQALSLAGQKIPVEEVVVGIKGEIISKSD